MAWRLTLIRTDTTLDHSQKAEKKKRGWAITGNGDQQHAQVKECFPTQVSRGNWLCLERIQPLLSLSQWEPALCAENRKTNEFVCLRVCGGLFCLSCQLADIKAHRSVHKLKKRQPERWSSQPLHGSKMSILGLKDHFSRDPVQVQSLDGGCRDGISNDGKRHWPTALQDTSSETNKERFLLKRACFT